MIEILKAEELHVNGVISVWLRFIQSQTDIEPEWDPGENALQQFENHLKHGLTSKKDLVVVAMDAGGVVGFSIATLNNRHSFFKTKRWGTISDMAVLENYQNRDIGKMMLEKLLDWFRSNDVSIAELSVLARNQIALSFWTKNGFTPLSQRLYCHIN